MIYKLPSQKPGSIIESGKENAAMLGKGFVSLLVKLLSGLAFTFLVLVILSFWRSPRQAVFTAARFISQEGLDFQTSHLSEVKTEHFIFRFNDKDRDIIPVVVANAEEVYQPLVEFFGWEPQKRTLVVVYPDTESLARSFGWDKDEKAMGVYWGGSIRILSPSAWVSGGDLVEAFNQKGPMAHELAHLMVDYRTKGNYPRWFTEGIAQYVERILTGFEFSPPLSYNSQSVKYFSFKEMNADFDSLDQSTVYWESLKAIDYLVQRHGQQAIFSIMDELGRGYSMDAAFEIATGQNFEEFSQEFYCYLQNSL